MAARKGGCTEHRGVGDTVPTLPQTPSKPPPPEPHPSGEGEQKLLSLHPGLRCFCSKDLVKSLKHLGSKSSCLGGSGARTPRTSTLEHGGLGLKFSSATFKCFPQIFL